jgi:hypothetical protein
LKHKFLYIISSDFLEEYLRLRKGWLQLFRKLGKDDFSTNEATIGGITFFKVVIFLEEEERELVYEFLNTDD